MIQGCTNLVVSVRNDYLPGDYSVPKSFPRREKCLLLMGHKGCAAGWASEIYTARLTIKGFHMKLSYVPVKSKLQHPPPPGHLNFWKIFVQIPPSRGRKTVQMPHHRSIPSDQMPPPPGNFSVAFIMLRKLCM